jgi:hypothetical protein
MSNRTSANTKMSMMVMDVKYKEMLRPAIAHMLYEFLPLIDEHNKARQNVLALEKVWMTKNPWNRLVISFAGMGVVDLQRWDRQMRQNYASRGPVLDYIGDDDEDQIQVFDHNIKQIADFMGKPLTDGTFKYRDGAQPTSRMTSTAARVDPLIRIAAADGSTSTVCKDGKTRSRQQSCFVCRVYDPKKKNTQWKCRM